MSSNLIALQNKFLGHGETIYDILARHREHHGALSDADIERLADEHQLPRAHVRSVAKFYDELKIDQAEQKKIKVCIGEACTAAGGRGCRAHLESSESDIKIGEVACLGYCGLGPNAMVGTEVRSMSDISPQALLDAVSTQSDLPGQEPVNQYIKTNQCPQIVSARFEKPALSLADAQADGVYEMLKKALFDSSPQAVIAEIKASQIRGRGGAGFPAGIKLETAAGTKADQRYVVCNADEGDAGAYIDKEIMERDPHNLLEGCLLAAYAIGASEIYLYVRHEYPHSNRILRQAIQEAQAAALIGERILGSEFSCDVKLVEGQGAYICGEETSLLRSLEGVPAMVSAKPPFPAVEGLFGKPTAVNNVETLANFPWILRHGGAQYAALGYEKSRGTKVISINSVVKNPGLYEISLGMTLREIIFDLCGGMADGKEFKAVQVGGPLGGIFPERLLDIPLDFEAMGAAKGLLGHAGIVVYDSSVDLIQIGRDLMKFCAVESCGKCFPCRIGAVRGTELFDKILARQATDADQSLMAELCETMKYGSLCALGGAIPTPIENLLEYFPEEWSTYIGNEAQETRV